MLFRKKKTAMFGGNIEMNCSYCRSNGAKQGGEPVCVLGLAPKNGKCKKYVYDPLRREPKKAPELKKQAYSEDDFKL